MEINGLSAAGRYAAAQPATRPSPRLDEASLGQIMGDAVIDFATTLQASEQQTIAAMVSDADPHALVQALLQTELAVDTAVTIRNKVVEAYQEILRMPV